jgi:hypothetical protein
MEAFLSDSQITVSASQFAQKLRERFPQYVSLADDRLLEFFLRQNPQYRVIYEGNSPVNVSWDRSAPVPVMQEEESSPSPSMDTSPALVAKAPESLTSPATSDGSAEVFTSSPAPKVEPIAASPVEPSAELKDQVSPDEPMKLCPLCGTQNRVANVICRLCGMDMTEAAPSLRSTKHSPEKEMSDYPRKGTIVRHAEEGWVGVVTGCEPKKNAVSVQHVSKGRTETRCFTIAGFNQRFDAASVAASAQKINNISHPAGRNSFQWGFDIISALVFVILACYCISTGDLGGALLAYSMYWIGAYVYTLPARLAFKDEKPNQVAILSLNLLLGWTFVGWVIALTWALAKEGAQSHVC